MITFKQFLSESVILTDDLNTCIETLRKDCSEFLRQVNIPLYRGTDTDEIILMQAFKTPENRRPLSSSSGFSKILDDAIEKVVGFKTRSQATFATGHRSMASDYGPLHLMFPKNGFKFAWSPDVDDLYNAFEEGSDNLYIEAARDILVKSAEDAGDDEYATDIEHWSDGDIVTQVLGLMHRGDKEPAEKVAKLIAQDYKTDELLRAVKSRNEIAFSGDFYLVNVGVLQEKHDHSVEAFLELL